MQAQNSLAFLLLLLRVLQLYVQLQNYNTWLDHVNRNKTDGQLVNCYKPYWDHFSLHGAQLHLQVIGMVYS